MGIKLNDIFKSENKIYIIYELTEKHFNKYGKYLEIDYDFIHLYPVEFEECLLKSKNGFDNGARILFTNKIEKDNFNNDYYKFDIHREIDKNRVTRRNVTISII